jgi:Dyp-type peroxidase family
MNGTTYSTAYPSAKTSKTKERFEKLLNGLPIGYKGEYKGLLEDLQANILKSHRRKHACSLFIHFTNHDQALEWIAALPISNAKDQLEDRDDCQVTCFYMTFKGYDALGLRHVSPFVGKHNAFMEGMNGRTVFEAENGERDPKLYPHEGQKALDIHAMLFVADDNQQVLESTINAHLANLSGSAHTTLQMGLMKYNDQQKVVEWFGFRDGISQPQFFPDASAVKKQHLHQNELSPLSTVLIKDQGGDNWFSTGSFLAFLKLEQNVAAFEEMVDAVAEAANTNDKELAAAYILGRFRNGDPVSLVGEMTTAPTRRPSNEFDYTNHYVKSTSGSRVDYNNDQDGIRCPFHAHVRKANPRTDEGTAHQQIVRRGILYDNRLDAPNSNEYDPDDKPSKDVGMLFMSFQSSLEGQFEQTLNGWMLNPNNDGTDAATGIDMLVGAREGANASRWYVPTKWNSADPDHKALVPLKKGCIQFKGGEYFFAPSVSFLKNIANKTMRLNLQLGFPLLRLP